MSAREVTVLMTGVRGVIGSRLVERLDRRDECRRIVVLDMAPPPRKLRKVAFRRIDWTDKSARDRAAEAIARETPSAVVHLAFLQHPARDVGYADALERRGTACLLAVLAGVASDAAPVRLVLGSSTILYGARPENPSFLTEDAPLAARRDYAFAATKLDAESHARKFSETRGGSVIVIRTAPLLGGGARTLASRYLSLPAVPTILGFNPMLQLLTPDDAAAAFERAVFAPERARYRAYNVAGRDVLPLHAAIRIAGRGNLPMPSIVAYPLMDALFPTGAAIAPGAHLDYIRYPFVADVDRARADLGFVARDSTKDAVVSFARSDQRDAA